MNHLVKDENEVITYFTLCLSIVWCTSGFRVGSNLTISYARCNSLTETERRGWDGMG